PEQPRKREAVRSVFGKESGKKSCSWPCADGARKLPFIGRIAMLPNWFTLLRRGRRTRPTRPALPKAYLHCEALEKRVLLFGPGHGYDPPVAVNDSYNV